MRVTFWGTRGSLAKPGRQTLRFGGNTACIQVESDDGTLIVLDCGTSAHGLGQHLVQGARAPLHGHVFISHTHWDHIQGLPFFAPFFQPGNEWDVYGPGGLAESMRETLSGQMQYEYFPITLEAMGATVRYHNLGEGRLEVGGVRVRTRYLNHPTLTLGYRLEVDGATLVYACDHEPHAGLSTLEGGALTTQDRAHVDFLRGADLVVHDAQYTDAEYRKKVGWGHSPLGYAARVCREAGVQRLAVTHHDPLRADDDLESTIAAFSKSLEGGSARLEVFAAAEGQVIELRGTAREETGVETPPRDEASAFRAPWTPESHRILVGMQPGRLADQILEAAAADELECELCPEPAAFLSRYREDPPSVAVLDGVTGTPEVCQAIRALDGERQEEVPVILVAERRRDDDAVTDWITTPFSTEYARTRLSSWLLRVESRWLQPPVLADEAGRIAALRRLAVLDTAAEERFDRITRIASAVLGTPISLISLVDADRQWFKSRVGLEAHETTRDMSFCAHALADPGPLVVADTLLDRRFADNPLVTGPPHIRFYAGYPLVLPDGHSVGTLCVIDSQAHELDDEQVGILRDLAALAQEELVRSIGELRGPDPHGLAPRSHD